MQSSPEVTLHQQIYAGTNGSRIYHAGSLYYAVDGEVDEIDSPHAYENLLEAAYFRNSNPDVVLRHITKGDDRFPQK